MSLVWVIHQVVILTFVAAAVHSRYNGGRWTKEWDDKIPPGFESDDNNKIKVTWGHEVINSTLSRNGHYSQITVSVTAFGKQYDLELQLNKYLLARSYVEKLVTPSGAIYHKVNHTTGHCYYVGKVRGDPRSGAAISTCNGIVGHFAIGNISFHIDPQSDKITGPHKVYKGHGDEGIIYNCGHDKASLDKLLNPLQNNKRVKRTFIWPENLDDKTKVVEVYIANDFSQFVSKGNDTSLLFQRTKDIVNTASLAYNSQGIYLVLVGAEIWTVSDMITVNQNDKSSTLSQFASYRMQNINPVTYNDVGILFTNHTFGSTIGLSYVGYICSNRLSVAFAGDVYPLSSVTTSVMIHEIGHCLNLKHDTDYDYPCQCSDPANGQCVMYPAVTPTSPSTTWSQCSTDNFAASFQHGFDVCLHNTPQTIFQPNSAFCGNGIVEDGEQCDCGNATSQECNSSCCNSTTCQLITPATCAYGRCCNTSTCQILPCGTTCRPESGNCDLAEYCDGQNALCPDNTHKSDGIDCTENGVAAYCYNGKCQSHQSQCELIWGPGTNVSADICYTRWNVRGTWYGNCGINWLPSVTYPPCQTNDVFCGRLQCQDYNKPLFYYQIAYVQGGGGIGSDSCHSAVFDFGLATMDPGLVPNGASCGTGKMCVNQQCVSASSVSTTSCTSSCQVNEVCNNVGQCQSTIGYCPQAMTVQTNPT